MAIELFSGPGIEQISNNASGSISRIYIYSFSTSQKFAFNAFLTQFSDSFKSNWTTTEIYGRMDPIATFKNTVRKITFAIDIPSYSEGEAYSNLANVDGIIQSLYPVYVKNTLGTATLSSPPLFRIKFANFIFNSAKNDSSFIDDEDDPLTNGLLCYLDGFDYNPDVESGFFINPDQSLIIPKLLKANFSLNIIHEFPLGNEKSDSGGLANRTKQGQFHLKTPVSLDNLTRKPAPSSLPDDLIATTDMFSDPGLVI